MKFDINKNLSKKGFINVVGHAIGMDAILFMDALKKFLNSFPETGEQVRITIGNCVFFDSTGADISNEEAEKE